MLSYSGLTSYGKVGIPSVESWGSSMNIMKDPPKSIYTKRKDKVGTTSHITQQIEDSGDRHNEAILKFARGINQFTDIEYSNNGSNIGRDNKIVPGGVIQSKLRNRIMKDGDFRPPIIAPQDLLPLSRPRRPNSSMVTNIDNVDFTQKPYSYEHKEKGREIKRDYNIQSVAPTRTYNIQKTVGQTMKEYIRKTIPIYVSSQKTNGSLHYDVIRGDNNTTAVHDGILQGQFKTQIGKPMHQYNNNVDTQRYTKETYINPVRTTKISDISNIVDEVEGNYTQIRDEIPNIKVAGNRSSKMNNPNQHNYQNILSRVKNIPNYSMITNTKGNGSSDNIMSSQYHRLHERKSRGSFMNNGIIPITQKDSTVVLKKTNKQNLFNNMKNNK